MGEATSPKLQADIIGTYPSSHIGLNDTPTPIPQRRMSGTYPSTGSFGPTSPGHRHPSSFNHPISASGILTEGRVSPTQVLSGSAIVDSESLGSGHPTVAETGIPVSNSSGPGPSQGQLERREPPKSGEGIIKLGSFGNADTAGAVPPPSSSDAVPPSYEASGGQIGR